MQGPGRQQGVVFTCGVYLCRDLADNKVFFQHPDLMRSLGIHETVMQLMVNTLNKAQQHPPAAESDPATRRRSSVASNTAPAIKDEPTVSLLCLFPLGGVSCPNP